MLRHWSCAQITYSDGANGLGTSDLEENSVSHGESISSSTGEASGLGEATATSVTVEKGGLCGSGEKSMDSGAKPGEED